MSDPLTPDQAKAQVMDAAREIVSTAALEVEQAWVSLESCNDEGEAPFRGEVTIHLPLAADAAESRAEIDSIARRLQAAGWAADPEFRSHATHLSKNGVVVVLRGQDDGDGSLGRVVSVIGECRDVTSSKAAQGQLVPIQLP